MAQINPALIDAVNLVNPISLFQYVNFSTGQFIVVILKCKWLAITDFDFHSTV